ncbi:unnamed protein product [Brassica oleracea]
MATPSTIVFTQLKHYQTKPLQIYVNQGRSALEVESRRDPPQQQEGIKEGIYLSRLRAIRTELKGV